MGREKERWRERERERKYAVVKICLAFGSQF